METIDIIRSSWPINSTVANTGASTCLALHGGRALLPTLLSSLLLLLLFVQLLGLLLGLLPLLGLPLLGLLHHQTLCP